MRSQRGAPPHLGEEEQPSPRLAGREEKPNSKAPKDHAVLILPETTIAVQDPPIYNGGYPRYVPVGEWQGYPVVYDRHELTWMKQTAPGVLLQMYPEDIEAFLDEQEHDSLLGQPDAREYALRGVSRGVRLGMGEW